MIIKKKFRYQSAYAMDISYTHLHSRSGSIFNEAHAKDLYQQPILQNTEVYCAQLP